MVSISVAITDRQLSDRMPEEADFSFFYEGDTTKYIVVISGSEATSCFCV